MSKPTDPEIDLPLRLPSEDPAPPTAETLLKASVVLTIYLDVQLGPEPDGTPEST